MEQFEGDFAPFKVIEIRANGPWRFVLEGAGGESSSSYNAASVLDEVRPRINDLDGIVYTDGELISYLNTAIDYLNGYLIGLKKPEMIQEISIADGTPVPIDWDTFAGQYPAYIIQDTLKLFEGHERVTVRYFSLMPHVTTVSDVVLFKMRYKSILVHIVAMYALNRNEYDISQDKELLNDLLQVTR